MILLGDIGNTDTKICLVNSNNKIVKRLNFNTKNIDYFILKKKFKKINFKNIKINKCLFCSVVPKSYKLIKSFLIQKYNLKSYELKNLPLNKFIKIKANNKQIGSDRLANAISVMNKKDNFVIIDFGTATTFDVLIKNFYHGGIIAPGLKISLNTLVEKASLIPDLNLKKVNKVIGLNTVSAVRSGFFWGYTGLIKNILKLIKQETKKSFKIIMTGGFSNLFKDSINYKATINKDITIKGLIKASKLINQK